MSSQSTGRRRPTTPGRVVTSLLIGTAPLVLIVALAAMAPLANNSFITPIDGRILTLAWWFLFPLGVAATVMRSRRLWTGAVVGAVAVVAFHVSMALVLPADEQGAYLGLTAALASAAFALAVPWALGMAFGWTALDNRRVRADGVPRDGIGEGGAPA